MNIKKLNEKYMYKDIAFVSREEEAKREDGSTFKRLSEKTEIKCKISKKKQKNEQGELLTLESELILFTLPDKDIKAGDSVKVRGKSYTAGEPYIYPYHMQVSLKAREVN